MADNEVVLLDFWSSPFAMRVKIALAEKGIQYEHEEQDLWNKDSLLLQMNPIYKKVPVLIHNCNPICESLIIIEYIDEVWNDRSPLLPSHPYHRAQAKFWADFVDKKIFEVGKKVFKTKGEEQEAAKKEFTDALKLFEEQLGDKAFFGGDNLGFVDVALIPFYTWFQAFEILANLKIESECPKFISWVKRCLQKESVSKSLADPHKVYEYTVDLIKRLSLSRSKVMSN